MSQMINNLTCVACGCICEGISVRLEQGRVVSVDGACPLCHSYLLGRTAEDGANTDQAAAITEAIEILSKARAPLITGLAQSTVETQRAAVSLADHLGATIDPAMPDFHRAGIVAMQSVGVSTSTLGEVKQRADVIVFWGGNTAATHPRLFERFIDPPGNFVSHGRYIVAINSVAPAYRCDEFLQTSPRDALSTLAALRALVAGTEIDNDGLGGQSVDQLEQLALRLREAKYSVIFFGPEMAGVAELESLFLLVRQLNLQSRSAVMGLGGTLCENVLTWQTGYPCGVNFALGYSRYDPLAYSANSLLERGEADAVLIVGNGLEGLSSQANSRLRSLPTILLADSAAEPSWKPTVKITTAAPGVHCGGTVFRMDGVPLRLTPVFGSTLPTAAEILSAIQQGVPTSCV